MITRILPPEAVHQGDLILVNPHHPYHPAPQADLVPVAGSGVLLERRAAQALEGLMAAIGDSLVGRGLVEPVQSGLLGRKQGYRPTREAIHSVVDLVRAELLEEGEVTEDVAALVILLDQGKCLKPYFSAFEQKEMQAKLQAIAKTPSGKAVRDMVEYVENLIAIMTVLVTVFT